VAAGLVAFHPALMYYDARKLHPLGFDTLMMMLAVWLLLRLRTDRRVWVAAATGAVMAFAIFQRGSMMLFCAASLMLAGVGDPSAHGIAVRVAVAYLIGIVVVIAPWAARNYRHSRHRDARVDDDAAVVEGERELFERVGVSGKGPQRLRRRARAPGPRMAEARRDRSVPAVS
jgi:4-amino-4-deoxy-L-arabinose transferase-like glycosyltransferase